MFKKLSKESKFIINYFKKFQTFLELDKQTLNKILLVKNILLDCQKRNNKVSKLGYVNFWINSKIYNYVENMHQIILLSIIDLIISTKR